MNRFNRFALGIAVGTLALSPAVAGKHDRAKDAIATAQGKVDASAKVSGGDTPRIQASAEASLRAARESLSSGHKERAIAEANRAQQLADQALGEAQKSRADAAQAQADAGVAAAQAQAADANARADAAGQAAMQAQADAAAARAQPPVMVAPAPTATVTSTETTKTVTPARPAVRKVVRRAARPASVTEKTTTTVSTGQ
ncbi:hypothetical protein [Sphingomonas sp.]|uniref:hypothetical protein n=1 Tax=Sphingomonas sp. TaxID=28214 RepID=UPI003B00B130